MLQRAGRQHDQLDVDRARQSPVKHVLHLPQVQVRMRLQHGPANHGASAAAELLLTMSLFTPDRARAGIFVRLEVANCRMATATQTVDWRIPPGARMRSGTYYRCSKCRNPCVCNHGPTRRIDLADLPLTA